MNRVFHEQPPPGVRAALRRLWRRALGVRVAPSTLELADDALRIDGHAWLQRADIFRVRRAFGHSGAAFVEFTVSADTRSRPGDRASLSADIWDVPVDELVEALSKWADRPPVLQTLETPA